MSIVIISHGKESDPNGTKINVKDKVNQFTGLTRHLIIIMMIQTIQSTISH